jgi:hypothetical protein
MPNSEEVPPDPDGWESRDREFAELRKAYLKALDDWWRAGGRWPVGKGGPTHPVQYEKVEEVARRRSETASRAMPDDPTALLLRVRARAPEAIAEAVAWLESDPFTWRTGYFKDKLMGALCGAELSPANQDRLRGLLLRLTTRGPRQEFPVACRLARYVDNAEFREVLRRLAADGDDKTMYAAGRMLQACETKGTRNRAG